MSTEPANQSSRRSGKISTGIEPREVIMRRSFTLEYWLDDDWYVGRLKEVPGVFSQGESLSELEENIRDAYQLLVEDQPGTGQTETRVKEIEVEV
jgi:predicted RNase H-like HicB family nuclease